MTGLVRASSATGGSVGGVVADAFGVQQAPVGGVADLGQRALFLRAHFEVRRLRELRELALRWLAFVPLLEPRGAGAQVCGDRLAAG